MFATFATIRQENWATPFSLASVICPAHFPTTEKVLKYKKSFTKASLITLNPKYLTSFLAPPLTRTAWYYFFMNPVSDNTPKVSIPGHIL
jgi:hypothetical protein